MIQVNFKWLQSWIPGFTLSPEEVAEKLNTQGFETEIESSRSLGNVVVGKILDCGKLPESSKLNICKVDVGEEIPLTIICGCSTLYKGLKVAVAKIGTNLSGFVISRRKLCNVYSEGMICSKKELGLKDSSKGIWHLEDSASVGDTVANYLQQSNFLYEVEVTPNRGDCMSIRGIAREVGIAFNTESVQPWEEDSSFLESASEESSANLVAENAKKLCTSFSIIKIEDIDLSVKTPEWLASRLIDAGMSTHNIVVDILNYVMYETGQPFHAYCANYCDDSFKVDLASEDHKKLSLLNGDTVELDEKTLVVKNKGKPVCIAGYMGDSLSQVTDKTTSIYLEAAVFCKDALAYQCRRYKYHTHAGSRFERGVDEGFTYNAMLRACNLLCSIMKSRATKYISYTSRRSLTRTIDLDYSLFNKILGYSYSDDQIKKALSLSGCYVEKVKNLYKVKIPSWRLNEMVLPEHVVTEVLRIEGFKEEKGRAFTVTVGKNIKEFEHKIDVYDKLRLLLTSYGWHESYTQNFNSRDLNLGFTNDEKSLITLENPLGATFNTMRISLLPGLLAQLKRNYDKQQTIIKLFECGKRYYKANGVYSQPDMLSLVIYGNELDEVWNNKSRKSDFFTVKGIMQRILDLFHLNSKVVYSDSGAIGMHPHQSLNMFIGEKHLASLGVLHPAYAKDNGLPKGICMLELDIDTLLGSIVKKYEYNKISAQPKIRRDLSLLVPENVVYADIEVKIHRVLKRYLQSVKIFDIYSGGQIPKGYYSISIGLIFQDNDVSLTDKEINSDIELLLNDLREDLTIVTRGE